MITRDWLTRGKLIDQLCEETMRGVALASEAPLFSWSIYYQAIHINEAARTALLSEVRS